MSALFPFTAIVGQAAMQQALVCAAIDPTLGGVLIYGDRGTGKSTAVRALADLLPKIPMVVGCPYHCAPDAVALQCDFCVAAKQQGDAPKSRKLPVPVVNLPLGATEDRVVGALDIERALALGEKAFEPGLLAAANRGFLYIDEVNLLEDHLVDLLLDVAASGENRIEREGLSLKHPARFVLVGSGNPEEGELRPQLLDRFGLCVDVSTPTDLDDRVEVIRRRDAFERDPDKFIKRFERKQRALRKQITSAQALLPDVAVSDEALAQAARLCMALGTDGLRGELTLMRAARALCAAEGERAVTDEHLRRMAPAALGHRLRRDPLDDAKSEARVARAVAEVFGSKDDA
ncbi:MAG: magnesium chelatase ATPase subunit I [Pseudomonadota bacterium]